MPTIYDIAKAAGVSHSTVSRVVNNKGYVSQKARALVLEAIDKLGYRPNELARGLAGGRTKTIAAIVSDVTNPFFTTAVRGVEDVASRNGYSVILCNTDEDVEKERGYIRLVLGKQIDGVILASAASAPEHLEPLQGRKVRTVLLDRRVAGFSADCVRGDSRRGAEEAVAYLVKRGHRRIALVAGPLNIDAMTERWEGYRKALEDAGLPYSEDLVFEGAPFLEYGRACVDRALAMEDPPTAALCTSNFIGIGALDRLRALAQDNSRLMPAMELVAFDFDGVMSYAARESAALVGMVNQPAYQLGTTAMELLLGRLSRKRHEPKGDLDATKNADDREQREYKEGRFRDVVLPAVFEATGSGGTYGA